MHIKDIIKNKVLFYLCSRYITYAVQFFTSFVIAAKLGPYYMGIWGFILLLLQYFQQFHLGIGNSFNVLYVQHCNNQQKCDNYIANSLVLVSFLALLVVCFYLYYIIFGINRFERYHADKYILFVCIIAILQYYVQFFVNLFRVKNQLSQVTFCLSVIVFLNFGCVFFFNGENLIEWLVIGYLVGNFLCVIMAFLSGSLPRFKSVQICFRFQREILKKGIYLFLYNSCFYFIIISIRTLISGYYSVEEFGLFTFSYTLAHAILLVFEALIFIIFPKVISKLSSDNIDEVKSTQKMLRVSYITSAHCLIYIALIIFPLVVILMPKYIGAVTCMNLIALTVLMSSSSFSYMELLISRNKEKILAGISALSLLINVVLGFLFVVILNVSFSYVIIATLITYYFYTLAIVYLGSKIVKRNCFINIVKEHMSFRLWLPYICAVLIASLQIEYMIWFPLVIFLILNRKEFYIIKDVVMKIIVKPESVNLQ